MTPIYKPSGRALEYSPDSLAINIYTGCPHQCYYCFAPSVLRMDKEKFHSNAAPRPGIAEAVKRQLDKGILKSGNKAIELRGKLIHLCFTCDPYPVGHDTTVTRDVIKAIKEAGCQVQILTKAGIDEVGRDFDLLDSNDWLGVTYTGGPNGPGCRNDYEPGAADDADRMLLLLRAHEAGISTWMSCEPVIEPAGIYLSLGHNDYIDLWRIGKMNYHPSDINWAAFGRECVRLCETYGRNYYIKDALRAEMVEGV